MKGWEQARMQARLSAYLRPGERVLAVGFGEIGPGGALCGLLAGVLERLALVSAWRLVFTDQRVIVLRGRNRKLWRGRGVHAYAYSAIADLRLARGRLR